MKLNKKAQRYTIGTIRGSNSPFKETMEHEEDLYFDDEPFEGVDPV